jgi:hypothetical protein
LWYSGKKMEAKGIFERQELRAKDINKYIRDEFMAIEYD